MCNGDVLDGGTRKAKGGEIYSFKNGDLKRGQWVQFIIYGLVMITGVPFIAPMKERNFTKVLELNNIPTLQYRFTPKMKGSITGKPASIAPPRKASPVSYG
jgi:hypothetical protein